VWEPQPVKRYLAVEGPGTVLFEFVGRLDRHEEMAQRPRQVPLEVTVIEEFRSSFQLKTGTLLWRNDLQDCPT